MRNPDGNQKKEPLYHVLAYVYDTLMGDVDYEFWADYLDEIIQIHAPHAHKLLELACGTGSVALSLDEFGYYDITATDASATMIEKAREKAAKIESGVSFRRLDFLDIHLKERFDVVFMVFDSINYLHTEEELLMLHKEVAGVLKPGGLFIYDFTTPKNSRQAIHYLNNEEGISPDNYRYFRKSRFDGKNNIHINEFEIEKLGPDKKTVEKTHVEIHRQKIYTLEQMKQMVQKTGYRFVECFDDFKLENADNNSLRITFVIQWQQTP